MRVPISWLRELVPAVDLRPQEVAQIMTSAGMEVTAIERLGVAGAKLPWDPELVRLAHLLEVEPHPNAERLVLATVDYGGEGPKTVVTGAPNLFPYLERSDVAELQIYGALMLEGSAYLDVHRQGKAKRLKGKELRGIFNDAMLASEAELGISDEHEGILLIHGREDAGFECRPGTPLRDLLGDYVLDVDIIPNIARCASMVGIAREVAALTGEPLQLPSDELVQEGEPVEARVSIRTENPELNPRFVALLIEGVQQKPAPFWMQHRLRLAGQRPINVVVDVSNYVMLETGQPNHTFDYDFLRRRADRYAPDGPVEIITRLPHPDESLTTLDGASHELHANNILVTDPAGNLSLGGIMGGLESEIQPETRNVLLEAAAWNFINIRQTGRQLGLQTEAGFRFSRGVHPSQAMVGARRAAELLRRHAGGTIARGIVDSYPQPAPVVTVGLDPAYVRRLSGVDLEKREIAALLGRLEFSVADRGETLDVTAPDHRLDIEGPHDLVEEVCRMYGYDRIPSTVLRDTLPPQRGNPRHEKEERIKDVLVRFGLQEAITYRLTTPEAEAHAFVDWRDERAWIRITNPSTMERVVMRHHLLPSLLEIAAANCRFRTRIALFEVGAVFLERDGEAVPDEPLHLAMVLTGPRRQPHWQVGDSAPLDLYDLKGIVEGLFADLGVAVRFEAGEHPSLRPGRSMRLRLVSDGSDIGVAGEVHPLVAERYHLRHDREQPVLGAEIRLDGLLPEIPDSFQVEPLPTFPAIREDLALVVDDATPAAELGAALSAAGAPLLRDVELFDVYTGDRVGSGKKSLAYHLTFQSQSKTLKDKDIAKLRKRILAQLESSLGARLRD